MNGGGGGGGVYVMVTMMVVVIPCFVVEWRACFAIELGLKEGTEGPEE
jgi:hypothetical protein